MNVVEGWDNWQDLFPETELGEGGGGREGGGGGIDKHV